MKASSFFLSLCVGLAACSADSDPGTSDTRSSAVVATVTTSELATIAPALPAECPQLSQSVVPPEKVLDVVAEPSFELAGTRDDVRVYVPPLDPISWIVGDVVGVLGTCFVATEEFETSGLRFVYAELADGSLFLVEEVQLSKGAFRLNELSARDPAALAARVVDRPADQRRWLEIFPPEVEGVDVLIVASYSGWYAED